MEYKNPKRVGKFLIDCEIMVRGEWLPFTANPNDSQEYGRAIYAAADLILPPWVDETASGQMNETS